MRKIGILLICFLLWNATIPLSFGNVQASGSKIVPVVMVHGYNNNAEDWSGSDFKKWLVQNGYSSNHLFYVDYGEHSRNDVTGTAAQNIIDKTIRSAISRSKALGNKDGEIDIVVHSMGGLITRWYLYDQKDEKLFDSIRKVVFIGTPNRGSQVAFYNRVSDMFDDPSDYFGSLEDFSNPDAQDIKRYTELYVEYIDFTFQNRKALKTYEEWLYDTHTEVIARIKGLEKTGANPYKQIGTKPLDSGYAYRYSKGFAEYVKLMYGRMLTKNQLLEIETYDVYTDKTAYPESSNIDEGTGTLEFIKGKAKYKQSSTAKNIVQDRLMSESFSIFTQLNKKGQKERDVITANLFLDTLNRGEAAYRYDRVRSGKTVPQYITIATKTDHWGTWLPNMDYIGVEAFMDNQRWGLWNYTLDSVIHHDSVVPIGNVHLPHVLTDRHVYNANLDILHSNQRDAVGLLSAQMLHPLTGYNDDAHSMTVSESQPSVMDAPLIVVSADDTLRGQKAQIKVRSNSYGALGAYVLGRDKEGVVRHISLFNRCSTCTVFSANVELDFQQYEDYVILNPDSDDTSMSNDLFNDHLRYTVEYSGQADEKSKDVDLTLIRDEINNGIRSITVKATDPITGEPLKDLITDDFDVDNGLKYYVNRKQWAAISRDGSLAVVLDYSSSMDGLPLAQSKQGAEQFVMNLPKDINLGVYGFADTTKQLIDFTSDHEAASHSVYANFTGGTAIYDTIERVVADLSKEPGEKSILLMTDGADESSSTTLESAVATAAAHHVAIHVVGLGDVDIPVLTEIANRTGGLLFFTADPGQLAAIYETIADSQSLTYDIVMPSDSQSKKEGLNITLGGDKHSMLSLGGSEDGLLNIAKDEGPASSLQQIGGRLTLGWWK